MSRERTRDVVARAVRIVFVLVVALWLAFLAYFAVTGITETHKERIGGVVCEVERKRFSHRITDIRCPQQPQNRGDS